MISFPNAKINLGLNITEKRPDGYHNLETIFYPISLKDKLEIKPSDEMCFTSSGIKLDSKPEDNLILKAYHLLKSHYDIPPVTIHLKKIIPFGGGLGGGSADASFTLLNLNELFKLSIPNNELANMAKQIGADCPFFLHNTPAYASGIGEIITEIDFTLSGYHLILVKPSISIPTKVAFKHIKPRKPLIPIISSINEPISSWRELIVNDFEPSVFETFPEIGKVKEIMYNHGAEYASLSGSGATIYGLFKKPVNLIKLFPNSFYYEELLS